MAIDSSGKQRGKPKKKKHPCKGKRKKEEVKGPQGDLSATIEKRGGQTERKPITLLQPNPV